MKSIGFGENALSPGSVTCHLQDLGQSLLRTANFPRGKLELPPKMAVQIKELRKYLVNRKVLINGRVSITTLS